MHKITNKGIAPLTVYDRFGRQSLIPPGGSSVLELSPNAIRLYEREEERSGKINLVEVAGGSRVRMSMSGEGGGPVQFKDPPVTNNENEVDQAKLSDLAARMGDLSYAALLEEANAVLGNGYFDKPRPKKVEIMEAIEKEMTQAEA